MALNNWLWSEVKLFLLYLHVGRYIANNGLDNNNYCTLLSSKCLVTVLDTTVVCNLRCVICVVNMLYGMSLNCCMKACTYIVCIVSVHAL